MTARLAIWDASVADDRARWEAVHAAWPAREVFAHPAYVRLFAGPRDRALAAFAETPAGWIVYPFVLREAAPGLTDLTTPYGYGGPFCWGDAAGHAAEFWEVFDAWARGAGVVSEFVRFSLFDDHLLPYPGTREQKLLNVVRSLDPSEDDLWRDYEHKVRKNVHKAQRSNVTIEVDSAGERLDEFLAIYEATMDRRDAQRGYYFPRSFFETIRSELAGQHVFVHALLDGRVISTELALVSARNVYSFLGGTDHAAFELRPNDLLKHELIRWAKREGKSRFVLGGGYGGDDGIFRYKKAFAPGGLLPFSTGHRVLDDASYERLVAARVAEGRARVPDWAPEQGFFPSYRARLPDPPSG